MSVRIRPSYPLRTDRLLLRPLSAGDAEALLAYRSLPAVCHFVPFEPMGRADVEALISRVSARTTIDGDDDSLFLGYQVQGASEVIGDLSLIWESAEHGTAEIGYTINPSFGGRGYATEAVGALMGVAFSAGVHRVVARIDSRNVASASLATRLGMRREAHFRQNEWFKGDWSDEFVYAILASEWAGREPHL